MKNLAIAFAFATSFFSGSAALADTGCLNLQGLSGEYCPVLAKSSQMDSLLAQGCVQIARNGVVVPTPYCPAAMFTAVVVEASMAPRATETGSDDDDSGNGGVGGDTGGNTEGGGTSSDDGEGSTDSEGGGTGSDGGENGGSSEAGGTASDAGESSNGASEAGGTSSDSSN
jgi:hypothetical protein